MEKMAHWDDCVPPLLIEDGGTELGGIREGSAKLKLLIGEVNVSPRAVRSFERPSTERLRLKGDGLRIGGGSDPKQMTWTETLSVVCISRARCTKPSAQA